MKNNSSNITGQLRLLSVKSKALLILCLAVLLLFWFCLPRHLFTTPTSYVLEDEAGNLLGATIAADGQWRFPYNEEVPQKFIDCITTFEDKRFFTHPGVDIIAIARATVANTKNKSGVQGGSTLTMQVIRLSQKNQHRTFWNKLKETFVATRLELSYTKKEIMALYASHAPFGSNVVGLDAAAWRYFGRSAQQLSWAETATLAVLPNAPSLVHPGKNRNTLLAKRNLLLNKLKDAGKISAVNCELAKAESLPLKPLPLPQLAPHLLQRFKKENNALLQPNRLRTTINGSLQEGVTKLVQVHHQLLKGNGINNVCALLLDVETGNTLAYVGNAGDPAASAMESNVDVIVAPRSPGSTLKPILYAALLSDGKILPNSLVPDIPTSIGGYTPLNFDLGFDGAVPANKALSRSLNVPAIRLLQQYKSQRFYELLQTGGITTLTKPAAHYGLSLVLGGCEIKMWELAGLYASLARIVNHQSNNKGMIELNDMRPPVYFKQSGKTKKSGITSINLDATSIYFTFMAMQEVMRPGEEGLWQQFSSSKKIAWKTGTSFGFRDGWAIGVTPKHVVAVWVGNADGEGRPGLIGVNTAAPLMFDIFRLLPNVSFFKKPVYNYTYTAVCRASGFRANIDCDVIDTLFMPPQSGKSPLCPYHKRIHVDASGNFQVNESCESPSQMQHKNWFILSPAMEYYYKQRHYDYKILPPFKEGCEQTSVTMPIELIYPQPGSRIYIPVEMNGEKGKTIFTAAHRNRKAKIFWSIDNQFLQTTEIKHEIALNAVAGKHTITLTDQNGISVSREFEILAKE